MLRKIVDISIKINEKIPLLDIVTESLNRSFISVMPQLQFSIYKRFPKSADQHLGQYKHSHLTQEGGNEKAD